MTTTYRLDVYPADDPAGKISATGVGARLVSLHSNNQLKNAELIVELRGMGSGFLEIPADHPDVQHLQRHGYVKVIREDDSGTKDIGGFWLERGQLIVSGKDEQADRVLRIEGEGPLYILSRYTLGHSIYKTGGTARGDAPNIPHQWTWRAEPLGGMLVRLLEEGTDHPDEFYAAVTYDFDRDDDSNGNAWDAVSDFYTKIGTNGLKMYADLQALGLVAWMDADLELHAYRDIDEFRTDRTSTTFAANKVLLRSGVNILSDMPKRIWSSQERSHVLIKDRTGDYQTIDEDIDGNPIDCVPWMTYLESNTTADDTAIEKMGNLHLTARRRHTDQAKIKYTIGPGGASGALGYDAGPGEDLWIGDLVTVDTGGASDYDFDNQPIEVASVRYWMTSVDWLQELEVGSAYLSPANDQLDRAVTNVINQTTQKIEEHPKLYIIIGDGSAVITTGAKPAFPIHDAVTVVGWTAFSADGTSGSISVDLWVAPYADFSSGLTDADSITAGDEVEFSSAVKGQDADVSNWIAEIPANSAMRPNVDSVTSIKILVIELWLAK